MSPSRAAILSLACGLAIGCSRTPADVGGPAPDAPELAIDSGSVDAPPVPVTLPGWMLEDVQPSSPRTGQIYGLDVFTEKIIVVSLLEGF